MAVWQISFFLVNEKKALYYSDQIFLDSLKELEKTFPEEKSWCESLKQYGKIDSTCIEIDLCNDEIKDDIVLRIDLRSISRYQLQIICEFANKNELFIKYGDKIYDTNIDNFIKIFEKSDAHQFLTDPKKYFEKISKYRGNNSRNTPKIE